MKHASGAKQARRMLSFNIQTVPRGDGSAWGAGTERYLSILLRGPTESDAVASEPQRDSYTSSAPKSKRRVTRFLGATIKIA
jgi:hypothetical protein